MSLLEATKLDEFCDLPHRIMHRLLIVQKTNREKFELLFDGRYLAEATNWWPLKCILLDEEGRLISIFDKLDENFPHLTGKINFAISDHQQPLWQLLQLPCPVDDPKSPDETWQLLEKFEREKTTYLYFSTKIYPKPDNVLWFKD